MGHRCSACSICSFCPRPQGRASENLRYSSLRYAAQSSIHTLCNPQSRDSFLSLLFSLLNAKLLCSLRSQLMARQLQMELVMLYVKDGKAALKAKIIKA